MRDYNFGNLIYELRKKRNLTQSQLGQKLGVSDKAVSKWENGVTKPNVDVLYKLADFFEVSVDELVSGELASERAVETEKSADKEPLNAQKPNKIKTVSAFALDKGKSVLAKFGKFCASNRKNIFKLSIAMAALAVVLVITHFVAYYNYPIAVPDVVGQNINVAYEQLKTGDFEITVKKEYNDKFAKDLIISQNVAKGERLKRGSVIGLIVSKGTEMISIPDVKEMPVGKAREKLSDLGFNLEFKEDFSDTVDEGRVITLNYIYGARVAKGSKLVVTISKGPDLIPMPNVMDKSPDDAIAFLQQNGISAELDIKCSSTVKEGNIVSQSIAAGEMISRGSSVTIYVSAGAANHIGNTNSNLVRFGRVASQGNWVYYINYDCDNFLYRMHQDGSGKQLLATDHALEINVVGEWVYYMRENGYDGAGGGIYKMKLDGSDKARISSLKPYWMLVVGDTIYYVESYKGGAICKMSTDGTGIKTVCNDTCREVNMIGDWFYYINAADSLVYKITTSGSNRRVVNSSAKVYALCGENDYLFCEEGYNVYRINPNGNECIFYKGSSKFQRSFYNYSGGWIYFIGHDFSDPENPKTAIYKMRPDTSSTTKLLDIKYENLPNYSICVIGNWIYFNNEDDNNYLYRIKTDGSGLQKVYN